MVTPNYRQLAGDLSKLEELLKKNLPIYGRRGAAKSHITDMYLYGTSIHTLVFDELEQKSALECKLDAIIDNLWNGKNGQIFASYIQAVRDNPRTKDVYRSKSTTHSFPWYHRNRKY